MTLFFHTLASVVVSSLHSVQQKRVSGMPDASYRTTAYDMRCSVPSAAINPDVEVYNSASSFEN